MINSVVLDLDGTLLNESLEISEKNLVALKRLDALGIPYFIATGRPEQLVKPVVSTLNYDRPLIMYNGSVIGHPFKDERLYSETISHQNLKDIAEYCDSHDLIVMFYTKDAIYSKPNYRVDFFEKRNEMLNQKDRAIFKPMKAFDFSKAVSKILIIEHDPLKRKAFMKHFNALKPLHESLNVVQSQPSFLDINPKGTSKGYAISVLFERLGLNPHHSLAIGDQENDISMKHYVGVFVSMDNALDSVKELAHFTTRSNEEDGVYHALKKSIPNF